MTVTDLPRTAETTPESENLARLREMLADEAQRAYWPEVQRAIDYLIADTFVSDLAA
jgi:hypothetical protein